MLPVGADSVCAEHKQHTSEVRDEVEAWCRGIWENAKVFTEEEWGLVGWGKEGRASRYEGRCLLRLRRGREEASNQISMRELVLTIEKKYQ